MIFKNIILKWSYIGTNYNPHKYFKSKLRWGKLKCNLNSFLIISMLFVPQLSIHLWTWRISDIEKHTLQREINLFFPRSLNLDLNVSCNGVISLLHTNLTISMSDTLKNQPNTNTIMCVVCSSISRTFTLE